MKKLILLLAISINFIANGQSVNKIINALPASSNQSASTEIDLKFVSMQIICTGLDHADGVIKLQDSDDGTNWNDVTGATITVNSGTSSNMIRNSVHTGKFVKAVWTHGTNTAGTITVYIYGK